MMIIIIIIILSCWFRKKDICVFLFNVKNFDCNVVESSYVYYVYPILRFNSVQEIWLSLLNRYNNKRLYEMTENLYQYNACYTNYI